MDYAKHGEIMRWDTKTCTFKPFNGKAMLCENDIKKFMRHCIRGLNYRNI